MGFAIRSMRTPLVLACLVLLGLGWWTWHAWQDGERHALERESHHASEVAMMLASCLSSLEHDGRLEREEINQVLEDILHASPFRFLVLEQAGREVLRIGAVPAGWVMPCREGGVFVGDMFIFCSKLRLQTPERFLGREASRSASARHEQLMILGGSLRRDRDFEKAITHLLVPLSVALLLLIISTAAWIMTIRSRLLAEQLKTERTRSAHLEDLGMAAAGLAHETKNPLGIISGIAQQIARDPAVPKQCRVMAETIIDEVDKSASRLGHFMTFARHREIAAGLVDVRKLIAGVATILEPELAAASVTLEVDCPEVTFTADEEMLRQILVNLILNSLQASSPGGAIKVQVKSHGDRATLVVEDQGKGIKPELLPTVFKPYVTGNPDGHGLGLAIVKRFTEDHGWTVRAESQPNRGTVIEIAGIVLSGEARARS